MELTKPLHFLDMVCRTLLFGKQLRCVIIMTSLGKLFGKHTMHTGGRGAIASVMTVRKLSPDQDSLSISRSAWTVASACTVVMFLNGILAPKTPGRMFPPKLSGSNCGVTLTNFVKVRSNKRERSATRAT